MEKQKAHYLLTDIKKLVDKGRVNATRTAIDGAAQLGYSFDDMKEVVLNLENGDLHKSMTTHKDHKVWQDVYIFPSEDVGDIYLKLSIVEDVLIVSFKEK